MSKPLDREKVLNAARKKKAEYDAAISDAAQYEDAFRTVANSFSESLWKTLPKKVKVYFEAYRDV